MTNPKTSSQRAALHVFCAKLAICLNGHGLFLEYTVIKPKRIPWTKQLVKDFIWKPVMEALTEKKSTEDMSTIEPSEVYLAIAGHFSAEKGIQIPEWPSRFTE